jgi:uncharacterized protein YoxC
MRPTTGDPRGGVRGRGATLGLATMLPGVMLVIIIFWALAAVLMLTGTLINAREIDDTVDVINAQVSSTDGIDKDLDNVKELVSVRRDVVEIREAAEPLTRQADQIISAAGSINRRARSILGTAGSINETADSINTTVRSINTSVGSIGSSVVQINQRVGTIGGSVGQINRTARSILTAVGPPGATDPSSIKASVNRILRQLTALHPETRSIDRGVAAINGRADRAIDTVRGIKGDFEGIRSGVNKIDAHANSIDCATLLNIIGRTQGCNR